MKLQALKKNPVIKLLTATFHGWMEDKALRLSAATAYYSIFSLGPLLVIAIAIAGFVFGADAVRGELFGQLKQYVGARSAESIQLMVQSAAKPAQGVMAAAVGVVVLLVGASGVFGQLKDALNTIWEVKAVPGGGLKAFLRERLLGFGMVLVIGFLLLTSLALSTLIAAMNDYLDHNLQLPAAIWQVISFIISFGLVTLLFAFILKVLPDARIQWRHVWTGAVVTAALFEAGKFGLSYYLGRESTASAYGAAGAVVLILLWVYYNSCILFFGAEFTKVYAEKRGHIVKPADNAVAVTPEQRIQEGLAPAPAGRETDAGEMVPAYAMQRQDYAPRWRADPPMKKALIVTGVGFLAGVAAEFAGKKTRKQWRKMVR